MRKGLQGLALLLGVVVLVGILAWQQRPTAQDPAPSATWLGRATERGKSYETRLRATASQRQKGEQRQKGKQDTGSSQDTLTTVALADLPAEARDVHRRLLLGGPFEYPKDGTTYQNRNRLLPQQKTGWYREFTVPTPGESDRGARRLVVAGCGKQLDGRRGAVRTTPCNDQNAMYWTDDHYDSFRRVTWNS